MQVMASGRYGAVAAVERIGPRPGNPDRIVRLGALTAVWFCDVPPVADPGAVVTVHPLREADPPLTAALYGPELALASLALSRQYPPLPAGWVRVPVAHIGAVVTVTAQAPVPDIRYVVAEMQVPFVAALSRAINFRTRLDAADAQFVGAALTAFGCPHGSVFTWADAKHTVPKMFPRGQRLVDAGRRAVFARL